MDEKMINKNPLNKKAKTILGFLAFAGVLAIALLAYSHIRNAYENGLAPDFGLAADLPPNLVLGRQEEGALQQRAPDFTILDINGNDLQLSDLLGTPIVLNFWTSWCRFCVQESPYFEALYREMSDEIHIIKVNLLDGQQETFDSVENFMVNNNYTFPLYFDTTGETSGAYNVLFLPMTFFINSEGYIAARAQGAVDEYSLRRGVNIIMQ